MGGTSIHSKCRGLRWKQHSSCKEQGAPALVLSGKVQNEGREKDRPRSCGTLNATVRCWYFVLCPVGTFGGLGRR